MAGSHAERPQVVRELVRRPIELAVAEAPAVPDHGDRLRCRIDLVLEELRDAGIRSVHHVC